MSSSRSLPFTISLLPLILISLFFTLIGALSVLGLIVKVFEPTTKASTDMVLTGAGAAIIFCCGIAAFKLKRWGIYGLIAMASLFLVSAIFAGGGMVSMAGLVAVPVVVAFLMKDFDNMD